MEKILIFPGGTEIGLERYRSLRYVKNLQLFSGGSDVSNPAPFIFKDHFIVEI